MYGNQRQIKHIFPAKKACTFQKKQPNQIVAALAR